MGDHDLGHGWKVIKRSCRTILKPILEVFGKATQRPSQTEGLLHYSSPCEDDEASATFGCNPT